MLKPLAAVSLVAGLLALSHPAFAITFSGTAIGQWSGAVGGPDNPTPVVTTSNLDGGGVATLTFGDPGNFGTGPNYFTFDGAGSGGPAGTPPAFSNVSAGALFDLGHFQYFNGTTTVGTNLDAASLGIALTLTAPADASPATSTYTYNFAIDITPNNTGNPVLDGDIVTIANGVTSSTFTSGGLTYTLALRGFSVDHGATFTNSFLSPENTLANADIYAVINQPALIGVPEPSSLVLLTCSMLGLVVMTRRGRQAR
jgi:hypothetical protein